MKYVIEDTKTSSGTRIIPMTEEVYECFKRIVENRKKPKKEPVIDGYKGFLFLDKKDMPEVALHWEKHFEWALAKHNRIYKEQLLKITPHVCRHTYCSNMAKSGMNPKTLPVLNLNHLLSYENPIIPLFAGNILYDIRCCFLTYCEILYFIYITYCYLCQSTISHFMI